MGKLIRLNREDIDMTDKVTFDFVPKASKFDEHLLAAERLQKDAAKHKADAEANSAKAEKNSRKADKLRRFTPHIVLGTGIIATIECINICIRDALSLNLSNSDTFKAILLYAGITILVGILFAYIAHAIVARELSHTEKDYDGNRRLALIHKDRAMCCEELAKEHIEAAFNSTN